MCMPSGVGVAALSSRAGMGAVFGMHFRASDVQNRLFSVGGPWVGT